jgi:hypothetical protein
MEKAATPRGSGSHVSVEADNAKPSPKAPISQVEADAIRLLMPAITEDERQLRQALRNAHAWASSQHPALTSDTARGLLELISDTASRWTFAPANVEDLTFIRQALLYLRLAANHFERLEGSR